jgi:hypothetical protein
MGQAGTMLASCDAGIPPKEKHMSHHPVLRRLALALALALPAVSLVALAETANETTDVEILANGVSEKLSIADLKVGETRQLYSEAGTLVTATRTAESLELDIGGDKTSIRMIEPHGLDAAGLAHVIEAHGDETDDGLRRVIRIKRDASHGDGTEHAEHADGHSKLIVIRSKDGEHQELDAAEIDALVNVVLIKNGGDPGSDTPHKQVIVKRKVTRPADDQ